MDVVFGIPAARSSGLRPLGQSELIRHSRVRGAPSTAQLWDGRRAGRVHGDVPVRARPTWSPAIAGRLVEAPVRSSPSPGRCPRRPSGRTPSRRRTSAAGRVSPSPSTASSSRRGHAGAVKAAFHIATSGRRARFWSTLARRAAIHGALRVADRCRSARLRPTVAARPADARRPGSSARRGVRPSTSAAAWSRRRPTRSCGNSRDDANPGRHDADGARRLPGRPPAAHGHARHARVGLGRRRAAAVRPAHRAGARFDDRVTGKLDTLPPPTRGSSTPRHRSGGDRARTTPRTSRSWATSKRVIAGLNEVLAGEDLPTTPRGCRTWATCASAPAHRADQGGHAAATVVVEQLGEIAGDAFYASRRQRRMWAAHLLPFEKPDAGSTPGGAGTMAAPSRRPWARRSPIRTPWSGASTATGASR